MTRAEFPKRIKLLAWQRCAGLCQHCNARLSPGNIEYHHDKECTFGGIPDLLNCVVLCRACHSLVTSERAPVIAKSNRVRARHLGIRRAGQAFPTNRTGRFKKKISGEVERRR